MADLRAWRQGRSPLAPYVAAYTAASALLALAAQTLGDVWVPLLFIAGAAVALAAWRRIPWPDQASRYLSVGAAILLMCAVNRGFYVADYVLSGSRFDGWPFFSADPEAALFKGEAITVLGTLVTVWVWQASGGLRLLPSEAWRELTGHKALIAVLYVMASASIALSGRKPEVAEMLGQLLPSLAGIGLVTTFLLPLVMLTTGALRLAAALLLTAPFLAAASSTGMKEDLILAMVPPMAVAWLQFRSKPARAVLVAGGVLALAVSASYVNFYRDEVWRKEQVAEPATVARRFLDEAEASGPGDTVASGLLGFVHRSNASIHRGWAVSIADEQGFKPGLVFAPLAYAFVPRILWPEKPAIRQGWEFSGVVFGEEFIAWSESSTAAGFYSSLYLGWGWPAVLVCSILVGILLAKSSMAALRFGGPMAAGMYSFAMLPFVLRLDETWSVGVLTAPIISLAYVLVIVKTARLASEALMTAGMKPHNRRAAPR